MHIVISALPAITATPHIEIAVIAAASVPVVGAILSAPPLRGRRPAGTGRGHLLAQLFATLGALTYIAAVLLGVFTDDASTEVIFTALVGATCGVVALLVARRTGVDHRFLLDAAATAPQSDLPARYALIDTLIAGIADRGVQDRVRADAAQRLVGSITTDPEPLDAAAAVPVSPAKPLPTSDS
ncbi:hypothetical protein IU474_27355 [Nocardia otitidiscaviarum]|uniref:hypothetical protein n=1 Tax=Nocardia otitidiscaviarum TaxID=1823 RepID=UPI001893C7CC|nr:hypothetical protein [Nocardia otitidiscaviarum]MBF6240769.1 hypothetical protein [Nocardia otitidiscaviarum]